MSELQIFAGVSGDIRTIQIDDDPWFLGRDICNYFGDSNPHRSLSRIDDEDKQYLPIKDLMGRDQEAIFVNESGLYSLLFQMQPQKANNGGVSDAYPIEVQERIEKIKQFKHWVTHEVIPQIRKTGGYNMPGSYAEALERLLVEVKEKERLINENETFKAERDILLPKAEFFDAVTDSKQAIAIGDVAKVLDMGVGRNKLFEILRDSKVLMPDNTPYQKYVDAGYFRVVEQKYQKNGDTYINLKTLVFQKGIDFIRRKLEKEVAND